MNQYKTCINCKIEKPISSFYLLNTGLPRSYCKFCDIEKARKWAKENAEKRKGIRKKYYLKNKECFALKSKAYYLKNINKVRQRERDKYKADPEKARWKRKRLSWKKFGGTVELFNQILQKQDNTCAICKKIFTGNPGQKPRFDHSHKMNLPRGILCDKCNCDLEVIENKVFLKQAIQYLKEYNEAPDKELVR
jgi:hypothetical protein